MTNEYKSTELFKRVVEMRQRRGDYSEFMEYAESLELESINLRLVICIVDTIIDNAPIAESAAAMNITNFFNGIRLSDTILEAYPEEVNTSHPSMLGVEYELYDGVMTMGLPLGDTHTNMFWRIEKIMDEFPYLRKLWDRVFNGMFENSRTLRIYEKQRYHYGEEATNGSIKRRTQPYNGKPLEYKNR